MKIFLSCDIEGCCGVVNWDETERGDDYELFRKIMTDEVNACIEGLKDAGVEEIVVRDAHGSARNLLIDRLNQDITLIREWSNSPVDMMDGLDSSFDGIIYLGYHSPSRSDGNPLAHSFNTSTHNHIKLNNKIMSEFHINTYYAMTKKVPVIMLSGDKRMCEIVKEENPLIKTVYTKEGLQGAIISKMPKHVNEEIYEETKKAVEELKKHNAEDYKLFLPKTLELEIHYRRISLANRASFYPGAVRLSSDKVLFRTSDVLDIFKFLFFCD